jgi:hypothetical protein
MTVYYKATRPDGLDFWTGTIAYRPGVTVGHPVSRCYADMRPNDPGTYLSVSTEPGEVLTGGSWPCRVFRVDPVDRTVARTDGMYPWKRGCVSVRVLEEVPAYVALGPNGERVAALVERVRRLTVEEATQLAAARAAAVGAAGKRRWTRRWTRRSPRRWPRRASAAWARGGGARRGTRRGARRSRCLCVT